MQCKRLWIDILDKRHFKRRNTLRCLDQYMRIALRLWNNGDREAVWWSPGKTLRILIKMFCTSGLNLVILNWPMW